MIQPRQTISSFAAISVALIFALCVLCVLLSGAGVYSRLVSDGQESYAQRTCAQYISTKIRQCKSGGSISVESFDETKALVLTEEIEGWTYSTRVYQYDGWLMELFSSSEADFLPEDGEKLMPAQSLNLDWDEELLKIDIVDEFGVESQLVFCLRGGEGDGV